MRIYIDFSTDKKIHLQAAVRDEVLGSLFETSVDLKPGDRFAEYSFRELQALGLGEHTLEERK